MSIENILLEHLRLREYSTVSELLSRHSNTSIEVERIRFKLGLPLLDFNNITILKEAYGDEYLWYLCIHNRKEEARRIHSTIEAKTPNDEKWWAYLNSNSLSIPSELQPQPASNWDIPYRVVLNTESAHFQRIVIHHLQHLDILYWSETLWKEAPQDCPKMLPYLLQHHNCFGLGLICTQMLLRQDLKPRNLWKSFKCHFLRYKAPKEALMLTRWLLKQKLSSYSWALCIWSLQRLQFRSEAESHLFSALKKEQLKPTAISIIQSQRRSDLAELLNYSY